MMTHIAGYDAVLSGAMDRAAAYCEDCASEGASATDLAYIYQTILPESDRGKAQYPEHAMFWRLTYRRMIGAVTPLRGLDVQTVDIPEAFHPTEAN
jgi:hypothetical protein